VLDGALQGKVAKAAKVFVISPPAFLSGWLNHYYVYRLRDINSIRENVQTKVVYRGHFVISTDVRWMAWKRTEPASGLANLEWFGQGLDKPLCVSNAF
jgi:hypothetical protein